MLRSEAPRHSRQSRLDSWAAASFPEPGAAHGTGLRHGVLYCRSAEPPAPNPSGRTSVPSPEATSMSISRPFPAAAVRSVVSPNSLPATKLRPQTSSKPIPAAGDRTVAAPVEIGTASVSARLAGGELGASPLRLHAMSSEATTGAPRPDAGTRPLDPSLTQHTLLMMGFEQTGT